MAVNTSSRKKLLSIVISIAIFATALGLFAIWFESMLDDGQKASPIDKASVKFWLGCLWSMRFRPPTTNPEFEICHVALRYLPDSYDSKGTLDPDFREALSILYNRNQTRLDIEICFMSERRCPNETMVLLDRFLRETHDDDDDYF